MADLERVEHIATTTSTRMRRTIGVLERVAVSSLLITGAVGLATFLTGWWVFDGALAWIVIGGIVCAAPLLAAAASWWLVRATVGRAAELVGDLRRFLATSSTGTTVLMDEGGSVVALRTQARSLSGMHSELQRRRKELPALFVGVRALTKVPGLVVLIVAGTLAVGALGTVLLLAGLIG